MIQPTSPQFVESNPQYRKSNSERMTRSLASFAVSHPRRRSLLRANLLVLGSCAACFPLSGFPETRPSLWLTVPAVLATLGMLDTVRCIQPRWNLYHGGIVLLLLMDTLAVSLVFFFLLFPYLF